MKTSPTQRSLKYLRGPCCCIAQVVERWNFFAKKRIDLFNWIDIVAVDGFHVYGVQTTSYPNGKARLEKARGNEALRKWIHGGGVLWLHEWKKSKGKWVVKVTKLGPSDLA